MREAAAGMATSAIAVPVSNTVALVRWAAVRRAVNRTFVDM
ncbi:MAG: hypothetical protein ACRDOU_14670 [Streptosporangiaceae bacterium]